MNIGGMIGIIMLISAIFLAGNILIDDFETSYVDTNISEASPINQSLKDELVTQEEINETIDPLVTGVETIGQTEGWLDFLTEGAVVLPALFINFLIAIPTFILFGTQQSFALTKFLGIPVVLITFVGIGLIVWFFFKIIDQVRRYPA